MKKTPPKSTSSLGLIEMGRLGEVALRIVIANLQAVIGISVDVLKPLDVPREAFQQHRQQYDAGMVLKYLSGMTFPHSRLLAITTVDLCNPILTYVYGEAELGGKTALVSNYRLRCNEDGAAMPLDRYYERLAKVSLHEVAHTLSLYHCEDRQCLMHFCAKSHQLDGVEISFCTRCEFMLHQNLNRIRL
jgi:archaemetzincin